MLRLVRHRKGLPIRLTVTLLALVSGCRFTLPPPTLTKGELSANNSLKRLCSNALKRAHLIVHDPTPLQLILQCEEHQAVMAMLNEFNVRIRTITITEDSHYHEERSYLSPSTTPVTDIIATVAAALEGAHTPLDSKKPTVSIISTERLSPPASLPGSQ